MTTALFTTLKNIVPELVGFIKQVLSTLISIFYEKGASDGAGTITDFGVVFLIAVCASFIFWGLGWVSRLLKLRN